MLILPGIAIMGHCEFLLHVFSEAQFPSYFQILNDFINSVMPFTFKSVIPKTNWHITGKEDEPGGGGTSSPELNWVYIES